MQENRYIDAKTSFVIWKQANVRAELMHITKRRNEITMIVSVTTREAARDLDENCCHFSQRIVINWAVADRCLEVWMSWLSLTYASFNKLQLRSDRLFYCDLAKFDIVLPTHLETQNKDSNKYTIMLWM